MKKYVLLLIAMLMVLLQPTAFSDDNGVASLTQDEQAYLAKRGPVRLAVDPDWYPYEEIDNEGNYRGIAADILTLISDRTGVKFEVAHTTSWDESLRRAKSGEVDALACLNQTAERFIMQNRKVETAFA